MCVELLCSSHTISSVFVFIKTKVDFDTAEERMRRKEKKNLILEQVEAQNLDYDKFFFVLEIFLKMQNLL